MKIFHLILIFSCVMVASSSQRCNKRNKRALLKKQKKAENMIKTMNKKLNDIKVQLKKCTPIRCPTPRCIKPRYGCRFAKGKEVIKNENGCPKPCQLICKEPRICCRAMTAACLSCSAGVSMEEYCSKNPNTVGCVDEKVCCEAMIASCLSCKKGVSTYDYCKKFPNTFGCK